MTRLDKILTGAASLLSIMAVFLGHPEVAAVTMLATLVGKV